MDLGHGKVGDERSDQHGRFTLSDERRGGSHDGFSTGDTHAPEEEDGKLANAPLEDIGVIEELDQGDEENDGGNDSNQEPCYLGRQIIFGQETHTFVGETQEAPGK